MNTLSKQVARILEDAPFSLRSLAREARIPHTTLVKIRSGHLEATPAVAGRAAAALLRWSKLYADGAKRLAKATSDTRKGKKMYDARRGGHAPGHLRDAFLEWIEEGGTEIILDDEPQPLNLVIGQLWNCSDILPSSYCDELDLAPGATYAQAVRSL